jgi:hypothetical protein
LIIEAALVVRPKLKFENFATGIDGKVFNHRYLTWDFVIG